MHDDTRDTIRTPAAIYALRGLLLATTFAGGIALAVAGFPGAATGILVLAAVQAWTLVVDAMDDGEDETT